MHNEFREAFIWHINKHGTSLADISRQAGVSLNVLKKLSSKDKGSTTVENAILIAAYYGKNVNQFIQKKEIDELDAAKNLFELMSPEDQRTLQAQMTGLLALRETPQA